jgi:transposase
MHSTDTKSRFIELRAKGWSLARIAEHLQVAQRTLVDWNRSAQAEIDLLRPHEREAMLEKILAPKEQELKSLAKQLKDIEQEISERPLRHIPAKELFRVASLLRAEIRKAQFLSEPSAPPAPHPTPPAP